MKLVHELQGGLKIYEVIGKWKKEGHYHAMGFFVLAFTSEKAIEITREYIWSEHPSLTKDEVNLINFRAEAKTALVDC